MVQIGVEGIAGSDVVISLDDPQWDEVVAGQGADTATGRIHIPLGWAPSELLVRSSNSSTLAARDFVLDSLLLALRQPGRLILAFDECRWDDLGAIEALRQRCQSRGIRMHVEIRLGLQGSKQLACTLQDLGELERVSRRLTDSGISVRWVILAGSTRVYGLERWLGAARSCGVDPLLIPAVLPLNGPAPAEYQLNETERLFLWDFLTYRLLEEDRSILTRERLSVYRAFRDSLFGKLLTPALHQASIMRPSAGKPMQLVTVATHWLEWQVRATLAEALESFMGRRLFQLQRRLIDVAEVATEGLRALTAWGLAKVTESRHNSTQLEPDRSLPRVLLIGAYGGEHIGDTAILGGVLLRLHQRYHTVSAILVSQRTRHTQHLVAMLDSPVSVEVREYTLAEIRTLMPHIDAVVFAGGPMMDLPKQLVKHLYTVSRARCKRLPFVIEGIGTGPWVLSPSKWIGRQLALLASRVSVRTRKDSESSILAGKDVVLGQDPAFDYLRSRPLQLTGLTEHDHASLAWLLGDSQPGQLIGINIRPIRHEYTEGAPEQEKEQLTRRVETSFDQHMADAIVRINEASFVKPRFVFFPMNAIQFGMSDLRSAYRIARRLPAHVDFRIWEGDASLDAVVALIRKLDLVIAMRFHAAIFGLSQERKVIGIDYRVGRKDKVGALMDDAGLGQNCLRVDQVTADWLFDRMMALLPATRP